MSQYKVVNRFKELKHNGHVYEVGDIYPAEGKKLLKSRAEELTKLHSDYGLVFLEEIEAPSTDDTNNSNNESKIKNKVTKTSEKSDVK